MSREVIRNGSLIVLLGLLIPAAHSIAAGGGADAQSTVSAADRAQLDSLLYWHDVDSAMVVAQQLVDRYPDDPLARYVLGRIMADSQRPELMRDAERVLGECLALEPSEPWMVAWCHVLLADICFKTERDSFATEHCERAIELNATVNATRNARRLLARNRTSDAGFADWTVMRSQHFEVHCSPTVAPHDTFVAHLIRQYESAYRRLSQFWGLEPDGTVQLYLYAPEEMEANATVPYHHAFPERREIHATTRATPGHELTHVFAYVVNPLQRSVLAEGIATVLDQVRTAFVIDGEASAAIKNGPSIAVREMEQGFDYDDHYRFAASFVSHLIREYGAERFLTLYASPDALDRGIATTYGVTLEHVEAAWQRRVASMDSIMAEAFRVNAALDQTEEALRHLDRVLLAYGGSPDLLAAKARFLNSLARYEEAAAAAAPAIASQGDATVPVWVACEGHIRLGDALAGLGDVNGARAEYREALAISSADNLREEAVRKLDALQETDERGSAPE